MKRKKKIWSLIWIPAFMFLMSVVGCQTSGQYRSITFDPLPTPTVTAEELAAMRPESSSQLLRAAEAAFRAGTEAQERGDKEAASRHFAKSLELIQEADLDPAIYYNLRREFERIFDGGFQQAFLMEGGVTRGLEMLVAGDPGVAGDLPIPFPLPEPVRRELEKIQNSYPRSFQRGLNRSFQYGSHIRHQLAQAGLPLDIFWLAQVESQYVPKITSRAGAKGMWQFMADTGKRYGLQVDNYVDERYNWERSTEAAIAYLTDLYTMFGDWPLAITAYNRGEGGVQRAIEAANGERDIWKLIEDDNGRRHLPQESREFYAKLLATILVASRPEHYGLSVEPVLPESVIRVPVEGSYSLAKLEREMNMPSGTLRDMNPEFLRGTTPPSGVYHVAVPFEKHNDFLVALNEVQRETSQPRIAVASTETSRSASSTSRSTPPTSNVRYQVRRGDTIAGIAVKYNVSRTELMRVNNIRSANQLQAGRTIIIPGTDSSTQTASSSSSSSGQQQMYRVKRGDTLSTIAQRFGVAISDIEQWNGISRNAHLHVNQALRVSKPADMPAPAATVTASASIPSGRRTTYKIVRGDTPSGIASKHNVPLDDLLAWNNMDRRSVLRVGEDLTLYLPESSSAVETASTQTETQSQPTATASVSAERKTHKAERGDTPGGIAQKYGVSLADFRKWNDLNQNSPVVLGRTYYVSETGSTPAPSRATEVAAGSTTSSSSGSVRMHKAERGDTPGGIAQKYNITLANFRKWNNLSNDAPILLGREYQVTPPATVASASTTSQAGPSSAETASSSSASVVMHKVQSGDTPGSIAQKYGISLANFRQWNNLAPNAPVILGREYRVSAPGGTITTAAASTTSSTENRQQITHVVTSGQNPTTIARQYGVRISDLFEWNNWKQNHVLRIGDKVTVYK